MSPEGFLEFRDPLAPASGFQSRQFREIEWLSGERDTWPGRRRRRGARRSTRRSAPGSGCPRTREARLAALADALPRPRGDPLRAAWHEAAELLVDHDEGVAPLAPPPHADGRPRDRHADRARAARRASSTCARRSSGASSRSCGTSGWRSDVIICGVSRTILITGATDGLGRALAERAVAEGWDVLAHGRSEERLAALDHVRTFRADLASLDEVAGLATAVGDAVDRLDVLVSNAGIGSAGPREVSADGHELRFAVNYLAGYALIRRLLACCALRAGAHRAGGVGRAGADRLPRRDARARLRRLRAYAQSKLAQIMFTLDLAEELDPAEVTATALHPGTYMPTKMVTEGGHQPADPARAGRRRDVAADRRPELDGVSGVYFDRGRPARPEGQALDADDRARLRELSRELTGV